MDQRACISPELEVAIRYRPFVEAIARRIADRYRVRADEDLVACGMEGLWLAHRAFDPQRGVLFSTFAQFRIRGAIVDGMRRSFPWPRRLWHGWNAARRTLDAAAARDPIAIASLEDAHEQLARSSPAFACTAMNPYAESAWIDRSFDQACEGFRAELEEHHPPDRDRGEHFVRIDEADLEDVALQRELIARMPATLARIPEREQTLIRGIYFEDRTLDDIGAEIGISKSWASRLHAIALHRLRALLGAG